MDFSSGIPKGKFKKCLKTKKCARCLKKCNNKNPAKKNGGRSYWQAREHWDCSSMCFKETFPRKKTRRRNRKRKQSKKKGTTQKTLLDFLFN